LTTRDARPHVMIGSIEIHDVTPEETDAQVKQWLDEQAESGRYVCTPNVDYVVRSRRDLAFREAINGADLRVPDGMWIVYAARLAGRPLRATVTGRLLVPRFAEYCGRTDRSIGLLGAGPGVAEQAADRLRADHPGLRVLCAITPPTPFVLGSPEDEAIAAALQADPPDLLFVALGAPKQEMWMQRHAAQLPGTVMIGVGAAFDVLAGRVREAPAWMTRVGLEWLFRLAQEPSRLARRYLIDDPWILWWAATTRLRREQRRRN
jgi:N-acetylglucosaminyldiphosphoundecaprenol N-acetyl-beta-D-mannosaminyltransferase